MLYNNMVGLVGNLVFFMVSYMTQEEGGEAQRTLMSVTSDFKIMRDVILIGLCGAFGQIFIFLTISLHDCYKLSVITTTRKCVSVVVSAFAFNHEFTNQQWLGATMVLGGTCVEVYSGNKRRQAEKL